MINGTTISPAFHEASKIRQLKQHDYGGIMDYFPFGDKSFCHELHKKTKRLVSLAQTQKVPNNESVKDNLLDLINYASYYYEWLEGKLNE
jgi:hypothetical protein